MWMMFVGVGVCVAAQGSRPKSRRRRNRSIDGFAPQANQSIRALLPLPASIDGLLLLLHCLRAAEGTHSKGLWGIFES